MSRRGILLFAALAVGLIALAVSSGAGAGDSDSSSQGVGTLKIVLGVVIVLVAYRQWSGRPRSGEPGKMPGWMNAVDKFTARRPAALAFALSVINPKNLVLVLGAGAVIAASGEPAGEQLVRHDTPRVHVGAMIRRRVARRLLGRHVRGRAQRRA